MKKITSLVVMLVLCCVGVSAQTSEFENKLIRIGKCQAEMVPNTWYFLHQKRGGSDTHAMPGDDVVAGGLVTDEGIGQAMKMCTTSDLDMLTAEEGVSASDYLNKFVRFVPVPDVEGAYNIQFGTGNWMSDAPANGTVNNVQYLAGLAGQYNFYLIKFNGTPNGAGRFGWNKYDMKERLDNNGAGSTVVFWDSGESLAGTEDIKCDDESGISGNRVWQIYDIEIAGEVEPYDAAFKALVSTIYEVSAREDFKYIDNLSEGINVGNSYGNYRPEDVKAFLEIHNKLAEIISEVDGGAGLDYIKGFYPTIEDLKAEHERYKAADEKVTSNKIPLAINDIAPGYYTINSAMAWFINQKDTLYYTQEEADIYNDENGLVAGDEGFVTTESIKEVLTNKVDAPVKALCSRDIEGTPWLYWANLEQNSQFLWKIESVEGKSTEYRLTNMYRGQTFNNLGDPVQMEYNDTVTVVFDYSDTITAPVLGKKVLAVAIRQPHYSTEGDIHYVHCGGHAAGAGTESKIVSWYNDGNQSRWYLEPIDETTADLWINGDDAKVRKMVNEANAIVSSTPAQFDIAKDIKTTIFENDSIVSDASQFSSPYTHPSDGLLEGETAADILKHLLDGNPATFWHSQWEGGDVAAHVHYLQVQATEALNGSYSVKLARRAGAANDHPVKLAVRGYSANDESLTYEDGDSLGTLTFPFDGHGTWATANNLFEAKGHNVIRFYWEDSNGDTDRGYWHCSGFNIFKAEQATVHEKTQYQVRETIINRLQAAMDAWTAANYNAEDASLINDDAFNAAYNELKDASEAWKAVYVDPAALREAINNAPAENLFVIGNNPGQWKEGTVNISGVLNTAKAYDESAEYAPAKSEELIKAIADATSETYANANKVQTGKWYRIKFPSEEMYETYNWGKTGAQAAEVATTENPIETSPALFNKIVAVGELTRVYEGYENSEGNPDTVLVYGVQEAEDIFEGQNLYVFEEDDINAMGGADLFRFIQATDSSYIMQHKNTGLFLRGGRPVTLSATPSYFYTSPMGAGLNLITYTSVLGESLSGHHNLHVQRDANLLTCWESTNLSSNSALLIEEVGDVEADYVPSDECTIKLWPGSINGYVTPVDITLVGEGAAAYGAELTVDENDTVVVLKKIEAETIKAGTPYILIADLDGDYISPADRLSQCASEVLVAEGKYGYNEKLIAEEMRNSEYVQFEMKHGMEIDTLQKGNGDLVGTFRDITVEAGKGLVAEENGFKHLLVNSTIWNHGVYVKADFDGESSEILSGIIVKIEGSIADGITDAINKVAKSGNIYTVDGKLVGKGNINAINNLPAGIYIVNGVKVTKK